MIIDPAHRGGFFSCSTVALLEILQYFNKYKKVPKEVNREHQYSLLKKGNENLIPVYFEEDELSIPYSGKIEIGDCMSVQWADYRNLPFRKLDDFIDKYFAPSDGILDLLSDFENNYEIDYQNTVSVFYRGNDKNREMEVSSYDLFLNKAQEIKRRRPNVKFLLQPDEKEFEVYFKRYYPDAIVFKETPSIKKQDSAVFYQMDKIKRAKFSSLFFAAVLVHSECSEIITHSGNIGLWLSLYRGNSENVHQIYNNKWY